MAKATKRNLVTRARSAKSKGGSWLAILATTTFGRSVGQLRAEVKAPELATGLASGRSYRLIVQSYEENEGKLPSDRSRPLASMQRAVTADELRRGVNVDLLELGSLESVNVSDAFPVVVAWVEAGQPDLEFDARRARPKRGSVYGVVRRAKKQDVVQISLNRRIAA